MIYLLVFLYSLPLALRLVWNKDIFFKIILSTLITYASWYIFSIFLIICNVNQITYSSSFIIFYIGLVSYELFMLYKNKKNIYFKKNFYLLIFTLFVFVFLFVNMFTYKKIEDPALYINFSYNFKLYGQYINESIYKYNSIFYLTSILGTWNTITWFTIFIPYIFGTTVFIIISTLFQNYVNIKKYNKLFLFFFIAIVISLLCSTVSAISSNWLIGAIVLLSLMVILSMNIHYSLIFVVGLFGLNFSVTSLVLLVPSFLYILVIFMIKNKTKMIRVIYELYWIPLISFLFILILVNHNLIAEIIIIVGLMLSVGIAFLYYRHANRSNIYHLSIEYKINLKTFQIIIINIIIIFAYILIILFMIYRHHPDSIKLPYYPMTPIGPVPGSVPIDIEWTNISPSNLINNLKINPFWNSTFLLISFLIIQILILFNFLYFLRLYIFIYFYSYIIFFWLLLKASLIFIDIPIIPSYVSIRIQFAFLFLLVFLWIIVIIKFLQKIKFFRKISGFIIPLYSITFFGIVSPYSLFVDIAFNWNIFINNRVENKGDFDLIMKNRNLFDQENTRIFSEVETYAYFSGNVSDSNLYINRMYNGENNYNENIFYFFDFRYSNMDFQLKNQRYRNEQYLSSTAFFNYLILENNSKWLYVTNIQNNYSVIDSNKNISILELHNI